MRRTIAFDLTRLHLGGAGSTPRGIDRVDMSFARRLFDDPGRHDIGLVPTPAHMGVVSADEARALAARVERHWREHQPAGGDTRLAAVQARLAGGTPDGMTETRRVAPARRVGALGLHIGAMLAECRRAVLRPAARAVPPDAVYVNTGQVLLGSPWPFRWLERRPDVRSVMLIHDVIPILYPEYSGPILARRHSRAIATAARHATALLATSHVAADEIREALERAGRPAMPIHVVPLPVSAALLEGADARRPTEPYFVTVGIMDQRKNHRLLLHVWRDLVRNAARPVPKLVIAGARGLRTAGLVDMVARSPGLEEAVIVASGLSSPALRQIIQGARALLMPSFTEGFGLPIVEALGLGVPVIASDIPAHREVGGPAATYLDPLDGLAWRQAITVRAAEDAAADAGRRAALGHLQPQTWDSYFAAVLPFLESL